MSALLIDPPAQGVDPRYWAYVRPERRPAAPRQASARAGKPAEAARQQLVRPSAVRASAVPRGQGLVLTRRGLILAVGLFLALMATSAVVLVGGFLSVSNEPARPATVLLQG